MTTRQFDPIAGHMLDSYFEMWVLNRSFTDEWGFPLTSAAKKHVFLTVAQVKIAEDERFLLGADYAESGRTQVTDRATGKDYLLRSESTIKIERGKQQREELFSSAAYIESPVQLLAYRFHAHGLDLWLAGSRHSVGRSRLEAASALSHVGTWPYVYNGPHGTFEQGVDPFHDIGPIEEEGEGSEGA